MSTLPIQPGTQGAPEQPSLDQLLELITGRKQQQDKLAQLAAQKSQGNPIKEEGQSTWQAMSGQGSPAQRQQNLAAISGILNRDPTKQTAIGGLTQGMMKGRELMDEMRGREKEEQMKAANIGLEGTDTNISQLTDMLKMRNKQEETDYGRKRDAVGDEQWRKEMDLKERKLQATTNEAAAKELLKYQQEQEAERAKLRTAAQNAVAIQGDIQSIRDNLDGWTEGMTGAGMSMLRGTDAFDQQTRIEALQAKLGLDKLRELRAAASSGASGMGNLTEKELMVLMDSIAKLDIGATKETQEAALKQIEKYYEPALKAYENVFGGGSGLSDAAKKYL